MPDPKNTPRQRLLDVDAKKTGQNLAGYRDGESYEMLKGANTGVGSLGRKMRTVQQGISPWLGKVAEGAEVPRYKEAMASAYWESKATDRKKNSEPTGYDAAMRGVVKPQPERVLAMIRNKPKKK
jgi:hypothetical protein